MLTKLQTEAAKNIGIAMAKDTLVNGYDRKWGGLEIQDGDQLMAVGLDNTMPEWAEAEAEAKLHYDAWIYPETTTVKTVTMTLTEREAQWIYRMTMACLQIYREGRISMNQEGTTIAGQVQKVLHESGIRYEYSSPF
jgi:hypothetical protein